ncbi:MAG: NUDIX hydrolase [Planctomycetota bacterium]
MHRRPLLSLLHRYAGATSVDAELARVRRIRSLVTANEDCFLRTARPGHITASAWVLSADRRRCLLLHHRKLGRWLQPGGHADGDPDVLAVALREAGEESGLPDLAPLPPPGTTDRVASEADGGVLPLDVDVHLIPERRGATGSVLEDAHEHHDVRFLLAAQRERPLVVSDESHDVRWFTPQQVREQTDEASVLRLLDKALPAMA